MDKKTVGYYFRIFDPGKNGLHSTDDLSTKLKYEFVLGDPNDNFLFFFNPGRRQREICRDVFARNNPLRNASGNNEEITIADFRHSQRWFECKVDPMMCKGDLHFFSKCPATPKYQRPRTHERTTGISQNLDDSEANKFPDVVGVIAEDPLLTRCARVCFTSTEDDQAEQHDHGTIDEVLGDSDIERGGDDPEPLLGHPESRPRTFNHEAGIDVFEIIHWFSQQILLDLKCRLDGSYVRSSMGQKKDRTQFSIISYKPASLRLRLVTLGCLAQTCSIRPRNTRQRLMEFDPHR